MIIHFDALPVTLDAAAGEDAPKTITGLAAPWDVPATVLSGEKVMFKRGAFDLTAKAPKLLENHDMGQLRGVVSSLADLPEGLGFTATFADTAAARDAIQLIKAGAYDSVSVGAVPVKYKYDKQGVMVVSQANLVEISLVAQPAFKDAVITEIAASEPEEEAVEENPPTETEEVSPMSTENTTAPDVHAEVVPVTPIYATAKKEFKMPSAVEYIAKVLAGGSEAEEFFASIRAAAPDVVTTDTPGVLPTPIVAPVYNNFRGLRPVVDAVGTRAMPGGGKVFIRPEVTTHTSIANQANENTAVQSGTFVVTSNQVQKKSYGGYVTISEQDLDWADPAVLSLVLDDMARIYANQTDDVAADNLVAGATVTVNFDDASYDDPATWADWIYAAAQTIITDSNGNLPNCLFVDPLMWRRLGRLSDSSKRPLFPQVGPMNAFGNVSPATMEATAFGLRVVVDRNFAANTLIAGDTTGFEIYEQQKGAISVDVPSTLSRTIAFRGYFATLMIDEKKFVKANIV